MRPQHAYIRGLLAALCLYGAATAASAQSDTITANPNAAKFRRIWFKRGESGENYGLWHGSIGDVNGDSLMDFAVYSSMKGTVHLFLGDTAGPSTTPYRTFEHRYISSPPAVGDFWGTGYKAFVLQEAQGTWTRWVHVHRTDPGLSIDSAAISWRTALSDTPATYLSLKHVIAADLDLDGDDELLLFGDYTYDSTASLHGQVWIYEGGEDFHVDTPDVILRDPRQRHELYSNYWGAVTDLDGDTYPDILVGARYAGDRPGDGVQVFWGGPGLPRPDAECRYLVYGDWQVGLADVDGDSTVDILHIDTQYRPLLFVSGSGKSARTRSFDGLDADIRLLAGGERSTVIGHLNDSARRYAMVGLIAISAAGYGDRVIRGFSGGPRGPDHAYDAYYTPQADGLTPGNLFGPVARGGPIGDVDGDGWDDALFGSWQYPFEEGKDGAAVVLAGGPYIPRDSLPPTAIRDLPLENRSRAVSVWPLPASSHVNIAWRGDLLRAPRRFEVHDASGRRIAGGRVPAGAGAALWRCQGVAAGAYVLTLYDQNNSFLTSTRLLIE